MKALFLNCSLKASSDESNTSALLDKVRYWLQQEHVETEEIRIADYHIEPGISRDMGGGDEWPQIREKVFAAEILIIGSPVWLGEKSSLSTLVKERLYASSGETNHKGQAIYYNKVAGAIITGNEDGAKDASKSLLYSLHNIGYTIPPNADAYWVGEAGPGPSYMEAGKENEFTQKNTKMMAYNLIHFARMLKELPIPTKGNAE
ncbi:flavodoxin family protein [Salsuginibacillus kocurii]|uniref:flavodoxin family protein n=1 Tax=Salsuginibacillus kocurii TaxID=427078 RepID=UPI00036BD7C9|nr:flavodoxin family protein [Salsuginibacillus kocurii]